MASIPGLTFVSSMAERKRLEARLCHVTETGEDCAVIVTFAHNNIQQRALLMPDRLYDESGPIGGAQPLSIGDQLNADLEPADNRYYKTRWRVVFAWHGANKPPPRNAEISCGHGMVWQMDSGSGLVSFVLGSSREMCAVRRAAIAAAANNSQPLTKHLHTGAHVQFSAKPKRGKRSHWNASEVRVAEPPPRVSANSGGHGSSAATSSAATSRLGPAGGGGYRTVLSDQVGVVALVNQCKAVLSFQEPEEASPARALLWFTKYTHGDRTPAADRRDLTRVLRLGDRVCFTCHRYDKPDGADRCAWYVMTAVRLSAAQQNGDAGAPTVGGADVGAAPPTVTLTSGWLYNKVGQVCEVFRHGGLLNFGLAGRRERAYFSRDDVYLDGQQCTGKLNKCLQVDTRVTFNAEPLPADAVVDQPLLHGAGWRCMYVWRGEPPTGARPQPHSSSSAVASSSRRGPSSASSLIGSAANQLDDFSTSAAPAPPPPTARKSSASSSTSSMSATAAAPPVKRPAPPAHVPPFPRHQPSVLESFVSLNGPTSTARRHPRQTSVPPVPPAAVGQQLACDGTWVEGDWAGSSLTIENATVAARQLRQAKEESPAPTLNDFGLDWATDVVSSSRAEDYGGEEVGSGEAGGSQDADYDDHNGESSDHPPDLQPPPSSEESIVSSPLTAPSEDETPVSAADYCDAVDPGSGPRPHNGFDHPTSDDYECSLTPDTPYEDGLDAWHLEEVGGASDDQLSRADSEGPAHDCTRHKKPPAACVVSNGTLSSVSSNNAKDITFTYNGAADSDDGSADDVEPAVRAATALPGSPANHTAAVKITCSTPPGAMKAGSVGATAGLVPAGSALPTASYSYALPAIGASAGSVLTPATAQPAPGLLGSTPSLMGLPAPYQHHHPTAPAIYGVYPPQMAYPGCWQYYATPYMAYGMPSAPMMGAPPGGMTPMGMIPAGAPAGYAAHMPMQSAAMMARGGVQTNHQFTRPPADGASNGGDTVKGRGHILAFVDETSGLAGWLHNGVDEQVLFDRTVCYLSGVSMEMFDLTIVYHEGQEVVFECVAASEDEPFQWTAVHLEPACE